jgi:hypothetical protein
MRSRGRYSEVMCREYLKYQINNESLLVSYLWNLHLFILLIGSSFHVEWQWDQLIK